MTTISAQIIEDSISEEGQRLTTMALRYPRFIHAEFMTHRVFSRNARSSRAVPIEKMIREVRDSPVVPLHWGKNQKGMQAGEEIDNFVGGSTREEAWRLAAEQAANAAERFMLAGYHKQIVNRLLEPFLHIDTLVSSTDWSNFFALRLHKDAEPHIRQLAQRMLQAMDGSTPKTILVGQYHLPYVKPIEKLELDQVTQIQVSVARCARISYVPFDGNSSIEAELQRYKQLVGSVPMHASPAEHQATPDVWEYGSWEFPEQHGNLVGWKQFRKMLVGERQ